MTLGRRGRPVFVALLLGTLLLGTGAIGPAAATPSPAFSVSLSATPASGPAPLLVSFQVSVLSGTPTSYNWSFGDGSYLNGSVPADAAPAHEYATPGSYSASVVVYEGAASACQPTTIHVLTSPIAADIILSASSGTVPLQVTLYGSATGGSGTYVSFLWEFGNGGTGSGETVQFSYLHAGRFEIHLNVTDSLGDSALAVGWVNVAGAAGADSPGTPFAQSVEFVLPWVAVGLAAGAITSYWYFGRSRTRRGDQTEPGVDSRGKLPSLGADAPASISEVVESHGTPGDSARLELPQRPAAALNGMGRLATAGPALQGIGSTESRAEPESLRISQRIVRHLASKGPLGPYDLAPSELTQGGMARALAVRQNSLTNVLRRLIAAGIVEVDSRHVSGASRRLKVYRLTPRGEAVARDLRLRNGGRKPSPGWTANGQEGAQR